MWVQCFVASRSEKHAQMCLAVSASASCLLVARSAMCHAQQMASADGQILLCVPGAELGKLQRQMLLALHM